MPKREKKAKKEKKEPKTKVKNMIQSVVVKIGGDALKRAPRRRRAPKKPKEEEDVMARVAPAIVYQQAPTVNLPVHQAFAPVAQPAAFSVPVAKTLVETVEIPKSEPVYVPTKRETLDILGDVVTQDEFPPTANFTSIETQIKSKETPDSVYTEDPLPFSQVFGNLRFGEEEDAISEVSTTNTKPKRPHTRAPAQPKDKEIKLYMERIGGSYEEAVKEINYLRDYEKLDYNAREKWIKAHGSKKDVDKAAKGEITRIKIKPVKDKIKTVTITDAPVVATINPPVEEPQFVFAQSK